MANWKELPPHLQKEWADWLATRPEGIQELAKRFPPWKLFRLNSNRVYVQSYGEGEDGELTLRVAVDARFGVVTMERTVFGIKPEDLTECDLPDPDEQVGCIGMTIEEQRLPDEQRQAIIEFKALTTVYKTFADVQPTLNEDCE